MINYIKIIRPINLAMIGCAVVLGMWITSAQTNAAFWFAAATTALAITAAAAYGNVVNDIMDVRSDRVSHPDRPLAKGAMTTRAAAFYAAALAVTSIAAAAFVSAFQIAAAAAIVTVLTLYSIRLKRTMLAGNFAVASLTAYALVSGSLPHPNTKILIAPAVLAFLLNFCRELVKDVQDAPGDAVAGWRTSAILSARTVKVILAVTATAYMMILFIPSLILGHFGIIYTIICLSVVLPIHIYWLIPVFRPDPLPAAKIGAVLKIEMIAGLLALTLDRIF